ncbi:MAG: ATP-binding protein [Acidobacteriaceae bacterium]
MLTKDAAPDLALPWVVRLRYGMVLGATGILLVLGFVFWPDCRFLWAFAPLAGVLGSNLLLDRAVRRKAHYPQTVLGAVFLFDALCLTVVLGLTGGPENPFSLLYLVQITFSVVVLEKIWTWVLGTVSAVCFGLLFFYHLPFAAFHLGDAKHGFSPHLVGMWVAFLVAATLIAFFTGRVSDALRLREQEVLALQEDIAKHERLASLVTLAAGAAHELGTPLCTIALISQELVHYASGLPESEELRSDAKLIRSEVERCQRILQRMSAEGAEPTGECARTIQMSDLLSEMQQQLPEAQSAGVMLDVADGEAVVTLPVRATIQSLIALVQNALDADANGQPVVVRASCSGSEVNFTVTDSGRGMAENVLRRVTEPFFTTKEPGKGMGLGTFLVRTFAERMGGSVAFASALDKGTTVTLRLPMQSVRYDNHVAV